MPRITKHFSLLGNFSDKLVDEHRKVMIAHTWNALHNIYKIQRWIEIKRN